MRTRRFGRKRPGNILVLSAVMMVGMLAMLALAVDVGYLCLARDQLQRSADSAAIAATWELLDEQAVKRNSEVSLLPARRPQSQPVCGPQSCPEGFAAAQFCRRLGRLPR